MSNNEKKILLIVNPRAGKMKSKHGLFNIINYLNSSGYITTVHCTTGQNDATQTVISQAREYDIVVCCGGDGTLNETISGILSIPELIPIGYIPTGSTNDLARTLGLPVKIKKSTGIIHHGTPTYLDIGSINNEKYFSYIASFGAFAKVSYKTSQKLKNWLGHFAYVLRGIKHLGEIHSYNLKVTSEDFKTEGSFIFGSVTNTTSIGGIVNFKKEDVDLSDGKFEVLLIRTPNNPVVLGRILKGIVRKRYDARYMFFFRTDHIEFEFENLASWTTDGEFGGRHHKVSIDNLHNAIQIIK